MWSRCLTLYSSCIRIAVSLHADLTIYWDNQIEIGIAIGIEIVLTVAENRLILSNLIAPATQMT
ncbi:MAG TPA: hypothetical protein VKN62_10385 [Pelovirga sp.]|nr:hypothetical protein [Pelovirga sp.]